MLYQPGLALATELRLWTGRKNMGNDLSEKEIVEFIVGDFEATWDALAGLSPCASMT